MSDTAPAPAPAPASDSALTATAADLLQPPPAMTIEQAQIKKAELFGTAGFAQRVAAGEAAAVKLWCDVTRALRPPVNQSSVAGQQYAKNMDSLAVLRVRADLSDEALDWAAANGPVSPAEKEKAIFAKQRLFKDKAWVQRYFDGDRAANSEMALINITLGSRVGSFQEIEDFKKAAAKRLGGIK
jgi:hypothetical protein